MVGSFFPRSGRLVRRLVVPASVGVGVCGEVAVVEADVGVSDVDVGAAGPVLDGLDVAVGALMSVELDGLDPEAALEVARRVEVARRRLDAATDRVAGHVDRSGAYTVDGHGSAKAALVHLGRLPGAEASARVRTARALVGLPCVAAAYERGEVPTAHVRLIVRTASNPRVREFLADADPIFAEQAACEPYEAFRAWLRQWESLADADGAARDAERTHERRNARVADSLDGGVTVEAHLAGLQGAVVAEVFDRFVDAEWHADWAAAREQWGDLARPDMLARTPAQRRADALVAMCQAAAAHTGGAAPAPLVNIVIDHTTLTEELARLAGGTCPDRDTTAGPVVPDPTGRVCRTLTGRPLTPGQVLAAALAGHVRRVVVDDDHQVIDLGRRRRLFTGAARDAALLSASLQHPDGLHCRATGCHRRTGLHVDHIDPAARGGPTDQANAQILCAVHNQLKEHGYRPARAPDGTWTTLRPDGTPITPAA